MICPGCGLDLPPSVEIPIDDGFNASAECRQLYAELSAYTLSLQDPEFIHQLACDAYAAQHGKTPMKPIQFTFALAGLYLMFEHNYTGRQVQRAHMLLAKQSKQWPTFQMI